MASSLEFGVLLPHFGYTASRTKLLETARTAEELGFDSLWARDHVNYRPHELDRDDPKFIDTFVTLSLVSGVLEGTTLGTAVSIPHRHPVHLAQLFANIDFLNSEGVIVGLGAGGYRRELENVGMPFDERPRLHRETVEIMRRIWAGEHEYEGELFSFENVEQHPLPEEPIPIWSGGNSPAAARRSREYCDGWLPSTMNFETLDVALSAMRDHVAGMDRGMPTVGTVVHASVDTDTETAREKVDLQGLLDKASAGTVDFAHLRPPESGSWSGYEDLEGMVVTGTPEEAAAEIRAFEGRVDHLIFDLRHRFHELEYALEMLAEAVDRV